MLALALENDHADVVVLVGGGERLSISSIIRRDCAFL